MKAIWNSNQREFRTEKRFEIFLTFCTSNFISAFHGVESFVFAEKYLAYFDSRNCINNDLSEIVFVNNTKSIYDCCAIFHNNLGAVDTQSPY